MNDEIEEAESTPPTLWNKFVVFCEFWAPRIGVIALIVMGVLTYVYGDQVGVGQLAKGFAGDAERSRVVTATLWEQAEGRSKFSETVGLALGLGFFLVTTIWIYGRIFLKSRTQAKLEKLDAAAARPPQSTPTLASPSPQNQPQINDEEQ